MKKASLFRRHIAIALAVTTFCLLLGQIALRMSTHFDRERMMGRPPLFFARLMDEIAATDRVHSIGTLNKANRDFFPIWLSLADQTGQLLTDGGDSTLARPIDPRLLPKEVGEIHLLHHDPGAPGAESVVRLQGEPPQYLLLTSHPHAGEGAGGFGRRGRGRGGGSPGPQGGFFWISLGYLVVSVFLAILLSMFVLFQGMRQKAKLANEVISQLQAGNLKARFPITKPDEIGQTMLSFNKMADEIERLVERLKSTEASRMALLQELAHDLRTPVASLKNLLETQVTRKDQLTESVRSELMDLSLREVEYFERLVEDLLFLARVSEPRYRTSSDPVNLGDLLEEANEGARAGLGERTARIQLRFDPPAEPVRVPGDAHLLRRLLRNALDNSLSFARTEVKVELRKVPGLARVEVLIEDDGPGLSPEALQAFGKRRISRVLEASEEGPERKTGKLSVGLGSVIMKTIAQLHRGEVEVSNPKGARIRISLPTA